MICVAALSLACGKKNDPGYSDQPDAGFGGFDDGDGAGIHPCIAAQQTSTSVGCEYYAVHMDGAFDADNGCFVAFVANTSDNPARVDVTFAGERLDLSQFAKLPRGSGKSLSYADFDPNQGIPPGDVAIFFLAGPSMTDPLPAGDVSKPVRCPVTPARSTLTQRHGSGKSQAFRIRTDYPVVAYQMLPYGGGSAAVTGATLLLPTSAYDTNYVAADAYAGGGTAHPPSMDVVAAENDTQVTILPKADIAEGGGLAAAPANEPVTYTLQQGEVLQITQIDELTGSPIQATKPIGVFAGHPCVTVPVGANYCDHAEQQIPPVRALGHEYVAATYRQRSTRPEKPPWRFVGAVDGTRLTYAPDVGGPRTLDLGQVVEIATATPFVVRSQDKDHPFLLMSSMTGSSTVEDGYGDADIVRVVPTTQYLDRYVFFTDPTYPETDLVVTRTRNADGSFPEVTLDCAGTLSGWQPVGDGSFEVARVDLVRHDFQRQGNCDNGRHELTAHDGTAGLTVWGWGTTETSSFTRDVSYGYPAGESLAPLTNIVVPPVPR